MASSPCRSRGIRDRLGPARAQAKVLRDYDAQAKALLGSMTLDEKVGQMVQAEQLADEKDIETYFLGSILSGGDSDPKTNSLQDWTDLYDRYQARALKTRLRIPILYGIDAVHGHSNVLGAVVFPHNIGLGATRDAEARGGDLPHHRGGGAGHRDPVDVRALRRRRPGRALGQDVRELRRGAGAGGAAGGGRGPRAAGRGPQGPAARAGLRQALRR